MVKILPKFYWSNSSTLAGDSPQRVFMYFMTNEWVKQYLSSQYFIIEYLITCISRRGLTFTLKLTNKNWPNPPFPELTDAGENVSQLRIWGFFFSLPLQIYVHLCSYTKVYSFSNWMKSLTLKKRKYKGEEKWTNYFMIMVKVQRNTETIMLENTSKIIKPNLWPNKHYSFKAEIKTEVWILFPNRFSNNYLTPTTSAYLILLKDPHLSLSYKWKSQIQSENRNFCQIH